MPSTLDKLVSKHGKGAPEDHWIPLSDLMTGLMMMFMLVAIVFMVKVEADSKRVKELMVKSEIQSKKVQNIAILYDDMKDNLYADLEKEFRPDLERWKATIDRDLTIRFVAPEVQFETGKALLKPEFQRILDDFFPRYVRVISSEKYRSSIEEIRIEGHTSTVWNVLTNADDSYFKNMELSQNRTRSTLQYVLLEPQVLEWRQWLRSKLTANGLSSSKIRFNDDGTENMRASQRVEFHVRTNADARIGEILKAAQE
jgi:outer membrane protein OmpA-like peptidoglycan-associated protein